MIDDNTDVDVLRSPDSSFPLARTSGRRLIFSWRLGSMPRIRMGVIGFDGLVVVIGMMIYVVRIALSLARTLLPLAQLAVFGPEELTVVGYTVPGIITY